MKRGNLWEQNRKNNCKFTYKLIVSFKVILYKNLIAFFFSLKKFITSCNFVAYDNQSIVFDWDLTFRCNVLHCFFLVKNNRHIIIKKKEDSLKKTFNIYYQKK